MTRWCDLLYNQCIDNTCCYSFFIFPKGRIRVCKIKFVSTGENRGKPCPVCKKLPSYTTPCKKNLKGHALDCTGFIVINTSHSWKIHIILCRKFQFAQNNLYGFFFFHTNRKSNWKNLMLNFFGKWILYSHSPIQIIIHPPPTLSLLKSRSQCQIGEFTSKLFFVVLFEPRQRNPV